MNMNRLRSILVLVLWYLKACSEACCNKLEENLVIWNATIIDQLQLTQFIENVTMYTDYWNTTNCIYLSLTGGTNYELDIVKLMKISINGSLVMESKGRSAEINCNFDLQYDDLKALSQTVQSLSRASLVLLDGLIFTGCPIPILIEEASDVVIQNCVFQHHKHGALSIYNSENITVKNCTFHNNTSDGLFTTKPYQGGAGGLSIGYNHHFSSVLINSVNILIIKCTFTSNTAATHTTLTASEVLQSNTFPGRGGAVSLLVYLNVPLNFTFNDSLVMNNFANGFGGGIFCTIHSGAVYQTFIFANNIFMNNTSPVSGGLSFINMLNKPIEFIAYSLIYNCTFVDNTAETKAAGAANITPLYGLPNTMVTFRDCNFYNNSALVYSGAVDVTSYDFFDNKEASFPVEFINCIFDGNRAPNGAAMNLAYYSIKCDNVTFKNNKESTIRVIRGRIDFYEEVSFINNEVDGSLGGAIYLLSSSQVFFEADTHLKFINNTGRSGAGIIVETKNILSLFDKPFFYNPFCFLQYHNTLVPLSEIGHDEVSMEFIGNNAIVGSAIYANSLNFCSWSSYYPPYFYNTSSVLQWPFISYINNGFNGSLPVQTPAVDFSVQNDTVSAYPGELIKLRIVPYDEKHFTAASMFEIRGLLNHNDSGRDLVFSPTVKELYPGNLDYLARYSIKSENYVTDAILNMHMNYSVGVSAFTLQSFDKVKYFQLTITACPPGHVLHTADAPDEYECRCNVEDDQNIISCLQDERKLVLKEGYWGHTVDDESVNGMLEYYSCPPGYCRCSKVDSVSDACSNVYYYDNDDLQCVCDRQGFLCGKCSNGTGVSALLNNCVSCGDINILFIVGLVIVDIVVITLILLTSAALLPWLYPFLYFIQVTPYAARYFPVTFSVIQPYLHYLSSAVSLYFPYDFCLYPGMTAVASYSLRYIPLLLTIIISVIFFTAHRKFRILVKTIRLSWSGLWVLIMLLYSDVVHTSVSILNCPMLTGYDGKKSMRWYIDGTVECFTGGHAALAVFAILVLGLCAALIVIMVAITMGKVKAVSIKRTLEYPFKEDYHWWASVELLRQSLTIVLIIIDPGNICPVLLLQMVYVALYVYAQPYQKLYINLLEVVMLVDLSLLLMITSTEEFMFKNDNSFQVTQCGQVTTVSKQAVLLTPLYYFPLAVLLVLIIAKVTLKSNVMHKIRCNNNHSKDDEDSNYLVDKPAQACYWEFNDKYELQEK